MESNRNHAAKIDLLEKVVMPSGSTNKMPEPSVMGWRQKLYEIIFEAETPLGRAFDIALLVAIVLSILAISLETVDSIDQHYHGLLVTLEWVMTGLFTIEYVLRIVCEEAENSVTPSLSMKAHLPDPENPILVFTSSP
jgi:hypothetical protein